MQFKIRQVMTALVLSVVGGLFTPASAQGNGWYLGAGAGRVDYGDEGKIRFDETTFAATEEDSGDDTSISLWSGYRFNRYFSIELGYMRNDGTELVLRDEANEVGGRFEFRTEGATLTVVGTLPLGRWEPYARAGVLYADTEARFIDAEGRQFSNSDLGAELIGALGIAFNLTQRWQAKLDGACLLDAGERTGTGESTVYVVTAGFTYRF